jgi:hypothetical protein
MKVLIITGLYLLISGCASLQDFKTMDAHGRAHFVCQNDPDVSSYASDIINYKAKIDEISQALVNGYRLLETCTTIEKEVPDSLSCKSYDKKHEEYRQCRQSMKPVIKKICKETLIPVDSEEEEVNLEHYKHLFEFALNNKAEYYNRCYAKVLPMTAEEAYTLYKLQ